MDLKQDVLAFQAEVPKHTAHQKGEKIEGRCAARHDED